MKTLTAATLAAIALGLTACGSGGEATAAGAPAGQAAQASLLTERPRLSADMEALPRLAGSSPAIDRLNAEFDRMDAAAVENAAACASYAEDGSGGGVTRSITRPMTGPAYMTLREHYEIYCGGAYPSTNQTAVTYDLTTGARADWVALLPGLRLIRDEATADMPADTVYSLRSPLLEALYERKMIAEAEDPTWLADCRDVWKPQESDSLGQGFNVWADAEHAGVAISADYAHVVQACGGSVYLTGEELRAAGAPAELIEALSAAKAAGNWAPKEDEATAE